MDMNKLFSEFLKSNDSNKEWTPEMEDNLRIHHHQSIGKLNSYLLDMISEEKNLKMKRALPKPQSKYHK